MALPNQSFNFNYLIIYVNDFLKFEMYFPTTKTRR